MPKVKHLDPTRTVLLRRKFLRDINRRFNWLLKRLRTLLIDEDAFGLIERKPLIIQAAYQQYAFTTDSNKLLAFNIWLKEQVDAGVLVVSGPGGVPGQPWTYPYVETAYKRGLTRAYADTSRGVLDESGLWYADNRSQFLRQAFGRPVAMDKVKLLAMRTYDQMVGVTALMSQQLSRNLVLGLASGWGAAKIAREMRKTISSLSRTRARMIARTEIIYAHAEGQLDGFQLLGVEKLGIMAEWSTAGDDRVCPDCGAYEGETFTIDEARGLIPLHPNCRCAWIPSEQA
jgi:SPP1 gp7 family putative phage head morphogenesis protein